MTLPSLGILSGGGRSGSGDARFEGEYQSMRLALCASAPSHELHVMPPRITRNSHRPRASDRTMVDTLKHQSRLPLLQTRWHRHHQQRKLTRMGNKPNFSREVKLQWAGSRETISTSGRGGVFFLTSLFIELIDRPVSANADYINKAFPCAPNPSASNSPSCSARALLPHGSVACLADPLRETVRLGPRCWQFGTGLRKLGRLLPAPSVRAAADQRHAAF
jgi:hypothetical protein